MPLLQPGSRSAKWLAERAREEAAAAEALGVSAGETATEAIERASAWMPDLPPISVIADYTGAVLDGQLPRNILATRLDDAVDVTDSSAWSAALEIGDAAFTIGAANGILNLTDVELSSVIKVTSVRDGVTLFRRQLVNKVLGDPPPSSGAGADSAYDNTIISTASNAYGAVNAGPLTITCGSSGLVELRAPLTYSTNEDAPAGAFSAAGKWQWRVPAGVWADVGGEASQSTMAEIIDMGDGFGPYYGTDGSISISQDKAGLTPGDDYEFQLLLRSPDSRQLYFAGSASAVTE